MFDRRRRSSSVLALFTIVCLLLITVDFRFGGGGPTGAIRDVVRGVVLPLQHGVAATVRPAGELFSSIGQLGRLRTENRALREELELLRTNAISEAAVEQENQRLQELLDMNVRSGWTTTAARVLSRPPGTAGHSAVIDAGADEGLREGMAVIAPQGLVGKLVDVRDSASRVELITSPQARYVVRVVDTGDDALLSGDGSSTLVLDADPDTAIGTAMEVVSRSFEGSSIPDSIPVGMVGEQLASGMDGRRFHVVTPAVDVQRLSAVRIILDAPELPELIDPATGLPAAPRPPPVSVEPESDVDQGLPEDADGDDGADDDDPDADPDGDADASDPGG